MEEVYMNIHTGSTGTREDWWYEDENGNTVNAVDLIEGISRRQAVGSGTNTADALHQPSGITGIATTQDVFQTAVHHTGALGLFNNSVFDDRLNFQVTLNPGDRINDYTI